MSTHSFVASFKPGRRLTADKCTAELPQSFSLPRLPPWRLNTPNRASNYLSTAGMSWRNQGITGSNNIPLGTRRRFGGDGGGTETPSDTDAYNPSEPASGLPELSTKRGRSPARGAHSRRRIFAVNLLTAVIAEDGTKRRKKRNRWGDAQENKAAGLMGLPTAIMANMTSEQLEAYTLHLRIQEISEKLRINDVVPADGDRYVPNRTPFARRIHADCFILGLHRHLRSMTTTVVA